MRDDRHSRKRPFALAMNEASYGRAEAMAARFHGAGVVGGKSGRLIRAWGNPEDPNVPPLQVLAEFIDAALVCGAHRDEALAPLAFLADRYGLELTPRPAEVSPAEVVRSATAAMRECTEATTRAVDASVDGFTAHELEAVVREGKEARVAINGLIGAAMGELDRLSKPAAR